VTLTARHAGSEGELIRVEMGLDGNEITPAGLTVVDRQRHDRLAAMSIWRRPWRTSASLEFDWIVAPYVTTGQLDAVRDFLGNSGTGRWSPTVGLGGHYITAATAISPRRPRSAPAATTHTSRSSAPTELPARALELGGGAGRRHRVLEEPRAR
jgi:phage tail sheath gpL-like